MNCRPPTLMLFIGNSVLHRFTSTIPLQENMGIASKCLRNYQQNTDTQTQSHVYTPKYLTKLCLFSWHRSKQRRFGMDTDLWSRSQTPFSYPLRRFHRIFKPANMMPLATVSPPPCAVRTGNGVQ
ncbi:unnamed protein product [Protopolystoma xenopodis]|uniref:Uncharacterized protein n=1 Tax=Protopolystoma xenopodis TaxID=117903 RepID=A0A448X417_9PLAT|nr:unnamed protein product [Protopolystoma xenopodis]